MKKEKPKKKSLFLRVLVCLMIIFVLLAVMSFPLKTVHYSIPTNEVTEPVRIIQVSDLHSSWYGKEMNTLINAVRKEAPDAVVLTGDIYDDIVNNDNTRTFLKAVSAEYPCFYISGNHELRRNGWKTYREEAKSMGITVLEGENADFMGIALCGASETGDGRLTFDESVEKCAENAGDGFNVLLAHYPENIDFYRSFGKFDLILSGHAHGGQWRVPFLINGIFSPDQGIFPEYAGGEYRFDSETMIVSRGLERTKKPVPRIFNNPELVVIDIVPESEEES